MEAELAPVDFVVHRHAQLFFQFKRPADDAAIFLEGEKIPACVRVDEQRFGRGGVAEEFLEFLQVFAHAVGVGLHLEGDDFQAVVGQEAFEIASVTLNELIQARRSIVQTHHTLAGVQAQVGLRAISFGGGIDKPSAEQAGERTLSVVRQAAAG